MPLPRPLMTGEVLDAAFRLFRAGLARCLPYSGLAVLVFELPTVYSTFVAPSFPLTAAAGFAGAHSRAITWCISLLLSTALLGVIALRLQAVSRARRPRFRSEILTVLKRWPAALIPTFVALAFPFTLFGLSSVIASIVPGPGLLIIGVPLLWPTALFVVTLPAFWCDELGPFAAISFSWRVSRRRSWRMFGALLATGAMVTVIYAVAAIMVAVLSQFMGRADLVLIATMTSLVALIVGAVGLPFVVAVLIVALEDLKLRERARGGVHG